MAKLKINAVAISSARGFATTAKTTTGSVADGVAAIQRGMQAEVAARNNISHRLSSIQSSVAQIENDIQAIYQVTDTALEKYNSTERQIVGWAQQVVSGYRSNNYSSNSGAFANSKKTIINNKSKKVAAFVGTKWSEAVVKKGDSLFKSIGRVLLEHANRKLVRVRGIIEIVSEIIRSITSGEVQDTTSASVPTQGPSIKPEQTEQPSQIITSSGATKYTQPAYTQQGLYPDANGVWGEYVYHKDGTLGQICTWNRVGELSCTYYTLRKLNERGLSYPCVGGPGNGAEWYRYFDTESGLPSYAGNNALYDLANTLTLPQENVVVSFASNFSEDANLKVCGHVMLIDKIYRDAEGTVLIDYSDNYPSIGSVNGTNPQKTKMLDSFMTYYNEWNGAINGVVVMGAGN